MPLTSFIGRDAAQQEVTGLLSCHRLVTLVGVGGIGKTRLAVESGICVVHDDAPTACADGVWIAPLASLQEPGLLA